MPQTSLLSRNSSPQTDEHTETHDQSIGNPSDELFENEATTTSLALVEQARRDHAPLPTQNTTEDLEEQSSRRTRAEFVADVHKQAAEDINRLASQHVDMAFNPDSTRQQIQSDIQELRDKYGSNLNQAEFQSLVASYSAKRNELRTQAMWQEVRAAARHQARIDFDYDPADGLSSGGARADLQRIAERYADIQDLSNLQGEMVEYYQDCYEARHEYLFENELNYWQRKWYGARRWVGNLTRSIGDFVGSTIEGISNVAQGLYEVGTSVVNMTTEAISNVATSVGQAIQTTYEVLSDKETYTKLWDKVCAAGSAIKDMASSAYEFLSDPEKVWDALSTAGSWIKSAAVHTYEFLTRPETWKAVKDGLKVAWNYCTDPENLKAAFGYLGQCLTDPVGTIQAAWEATAGVREFLQDMCDSLGLTDIAMGAVSLLKAPYEQIKGLATTAGQLVSDFTKLARGEISATELRQNFESNISETAEKVNQCISDGLRALKGGILLAGELTGITDCVMTVKYAMEGNWAMAGMHAGFALLSVGALTATVATGGAAAGSILAVAAGRSTVKAGLKNVLKAATKNFFDKAATQMGKQAIEEMEKRVGKEALQTTLREGAETIATEGSQSLAKAVSQEGSQALTKEATEAAMRDSAEAVTERILREANLEGIVSDLTHQLLKDVDSMSNRELRDLLVRKGVANSDEAMRVAKDIKKLVSKGGSDRAIKDVLEEGITKEVSTYVQDAMEDAFKSHFRRILKGEALDEHSQILAKACRENAERLGKELDEYIDELVESGWKGAKEGIEKATRKIVREGIEKGFKKFREGKPLRARPHLTFHNNGVEVDLEHSTSAIQSSDQVEYEYHSLEQTEIPRELLHAAGPVGMKYEIATVDGVEMRVLYVLGENDEWQRVSMQRVD